MMCLKTTVTVMCRTFNISQIFPANSYWAFKTV